MASPEAGGLLQLPVEIILNIVMQLGGWQPGDIGSLLGSSKVDAPSYSCAASILSLLTYSILSQTMKFILKSHEEHLSQQFTSHFYPPSAVPIVASALPPQPILSRPSTAPSEPKRTLSHHLTPLIRLPYTFPWTAEQHKRNAILHALSTSPLLDITTPNILVLFSTTAARICSSCDRRGIIAFKSHSLNMLLKLSDARITGATPASTAAETTISVDDARRGQKSWIGNQDLVALASVLALVWVASALFEYGDRSTWGKGGCEHSGHAAAPTESSPESSVVVPDTNLTERQCIYRELALAHGPYFLWCSVHGSEKEKRLVKEMLDVGVEGLKEYENGGGTSPQRSLQSVLMRAIADLKGCGIWETWNEVFTLVGQEIMNFKAQHAR